MPPLPRLMVAPNGARLTKADHPALPITIEEVVEATLACRDAGADGLHAHIRDEGGAHVLDAGLYRELIAECGRRLPGFQVQITTEAVGRYTPEEQRALVRAVRPASVSVAFREMWPEGAADADARAATDFYRECAEGGIAVQHILYAPEDVHRFARHLVAPGGLEPEFLQTLYVLGRYTPGQRSAPEDLAPFLAAATETGVAATDWAICAFGARETECLAAAVRAGGKVRVGFENNRTMASGKTAASNAERVAEVAAAIAETTV
ncbi:MAG: 3-keto-5-aminohexanoate cleavage protein [Pseudomonadota bacterium]